MTFNSLIDWAETKRGLPSKRQMGVFKYGEETKILHAGEILPIAESLRRLIGEREIFSPEKKLEFISDKQP